METSTTGAAVLEGMVNEVTLVGRVSQDPVERVLPSGDVLWTFRVVVPREVTARGSVDALDCSVWGGRARRSVMSWRAGDIVEVRGALRRRFFRAGPSSASRVEVEVSAAKVLRRAASA